MTLKAYQVDDGEHSVIVFGERNDWSVREWGASQLHHGDASAIESVTRAPAFDDLAGQDITARDYIERGWWFECRGCGRRVSEDIEEDEDENCKPIELEPSYHVMWPKAVWCHAACRDRYIVEGFEERVRDLNEYNRARNAFLAKFPGIEVLQVGRKHLDKPESVRVDFQFPGQRPYSWCSWGLGEDTVMVPQGDVEAWHTFRAGAVKATA